MNNHTLSPNGHSIPAHERDPVAHLFNGHPQLGVGVYDGLSALLAEQWEFDFVWVSSFCCSAAMGLPDAGIIGPEDILNVVRCVRRSADLPIVVDLDSGYGDAVKACHVVEAMARAGAAALCIEDNPISKRCSLYDGYERALVSVEEHISRLRAARVGVEAASSPARIIARTEALVAGKGVKEALRRATAYVDAGADAVFIQSLDSTGNEVLTFGREWKRRTPLFIAPTRMPQLNKRDFFAAGISHTMFANQGLRAAHAAIDRTFGRLVEAGASQVVEQEISKVATVASLVGAQKVVELEALLAQKIALPKSLRMNKSTRLLVKSSSRNGKNGFHKA
ncbi:MAG TPA: isocitrate lyase/PEP mutase family protein [Candidatus Paceibacterota bacterium]|nr:isocitrate lyase/PEP mutase family protein [Candidatus Paceibacterota bacterium]